MNSTDAARQLRRAACVMAGVFGLCLPALAQDIPGYPASIDAYDHREVALLPPYCMYTQMFRARVPGGSDPAQVERWRAVMGPTFESMHHYCWGLMKTNRALLLARGQSRAFYLTDAIGEFDYVLQRAPDDFVLLPEILTKKGSNLVLLGRGATAVLLFKRAVELRPDYWPAYADLSDYYRQANEIALARETLQEGLSRSPDASGLKRRLAELDGAAKKGRTSSAAAPEQRSSQQR